MKETWIYSYIDSHTAQVGRQIDRQMCLNMYIESFVWDDTHD